MQRIFTILILFLSANLIAQSPNASVVQSILLDKIDNNESEWLSVYIMLEDQLDFRYLENSFQQRSVDTKTRVHETITALKSKSSSTQTSLIQTLESSPYVLKESIHPYWIANVIFAKVKKEILIQLSNEPTVAWIGYNGSLSLVETIDGPSTPAMVSPDGIEPGIDAINVRPLWDLGYTGYGQVAFVNDTGVDPTHPALSSRYQGHYAERPGDAWFQYESSNLTPFDCGDHGTHVLGTMLGLDRMTNDTIGVAFNASWVGSPILCGIGTEDNVAALQWAADPDGDTETIAEMPDVINNSWYDPDLQGEDCQSVYTPVLEALEAVGIAVIFSAGNEGPGEMTITPPHNINIDELNSFTVAALRHDNFLVASFSSNGPSICGGEGSLLIKPEVGAPGVNVRSCEPNNTYGLKSGTSMASPHVCGAIMILKEAFPDLTGRQFKNALYRTCTDLGEPGEDNMYGMGMINVEAAYNFLIDEGHIPVPANYALDAMILDLQTPQIVCNGVIRPSISFENTGVEVINSIMIEYGVEGQTFTYEWTGTLNRDEHASLQLDEISLEATDEFVFVNLKEVNGVADDRPLNNIMKNNVEIIERDEPQGVLAYQDEFNFCQEADVLVQSDYQGSGVVLWYDEMEEGTLLGNGTQFTVPLEEASQTIYMDVLYNERTGLADKEEGTNVMTESNEGAIVFDVHFPLTLKTVNVYFEEAGGRVVQLLDENGEKLRDRVIFLTGTGSKRAEINFDLEPGTGYQLVLDQGFPLYHNNTGAEYPYEIEDMMTIRSSQNAGANDYYYFYDWEVEFRELCGRLPVEIDLVATDVLPESEFTVSADTLNLDEQTELSFLDASTNATEWYWDFGDGNTSRDQNPTHAFDEEPGTYFVSLTVLNADGCADASTYKILVTTSQLLNNESIEIFSNNVILYPNPVADNLSIQSKFTNSQLINYTLYNVNGSVLKSVQNYLMAPAEVVQMDVNALESGLYYLVLDIDGKKEVKKIVKM